MKWIIATMLYKEIIRPLIAEKVSDSESKIDDWLLSLVDKVFDYQS